jgi:hypothetical protein
MLKARHNMKGEPIIFAVKAAKINSNRTLSSTQRVKASPQENLLELPYSGLVPDVELLTTTSGT